ncbi:MAG TPA: (2Fe-2S)-binding protein [Ktedonobacteraceae bacterium]|jgi:aerobic-type carbon monoxide dehydrogenase small subunit (CoxS/CutS family)
MKLHYKVNGTQVELEANPNEMLLDVLRDRLDLRSVRATCGIGICGACTALVNGEPISTCILLAPLADGCEITTVEGLGGNHPVQRAFEEEHAFQCGYCTPGMILTIKALLEENLHPTEEEIKTTLGGNLCRCGCYLKIINAAKRGAERKEP